MGKKRISVLGVEGEEEARAKHARQLEQKKARLGKKTTKVPGLGGGQRVVDTSEESLIEYEEIQKRTSVGVQLIAPTTPSESKKPSRIHIRSKSYQSAKSKIDPDKVYSLSDALPLLRQVNLTRFDGTVELHLTLKENLSHPIEITLPHSSGKTKKVAIVDDKFISNLESGNLDLDLDYLLASPAQMPALTKFAKILGPRGLMPNPKAGTIVPDPEKAVAKFSSANRLMLKTEKEVPLIHLTVGKLSLSDHDLSENITAVFSHLPVNSLKKAVLKSTMSPAIKIML